MKTYTTSQIIEVLKPRQRAICLSEPYEQEIILHDDIRGIMFESDRNTALLSNNFLRAKWQLLPQYVTFEEAIKAYKEGKTIQSERLGKPSYLYSHKANMQEISLDEIENGKWSIVEEDAE